MPTDVSYQNRLTRDLFIALLDELQKAGKRPERLFEPSQLEGAGSAVAGPSVTRAIAGLQGVVLLDRAVALANDPSLPIRLGQRITIGSYGTFGFALMTCATVRDSISLLQRYAQVFFEPRWEILEEDGAMALRLHLRLGTPIQQRWVTELTFSQLLAIGGTLYRQRLEGVEIHFPFAMPDCSLSHYAIFGTKPKFNCEHSQVVLPQRLLDVPVKTASASDHLLFYLQCEEMLLELGSAQPTTAAVRRLLMLSAGDFLAIAEVANRLNMSERTLRRHLEVEKTSFNDILDQVRNRLATAYLKRSPLSVADIAHLLDYGETVNFRRAFVRWNGITPSEYRERERG